MNSSGVDLLEASPSINELELMCEFKALYSLKNFFEQRFLIYVEQQRIAK